jgi:glycosyltransferase involved in cell wall biosynthesis
MTAEARRLRVTFVSASGALGGAERVLLDLLRWSRGSVRTWEATLISLEDGPLPQQAADLGLDVSVVPLPEGLAALGEQRRSPASLALGIARLAGPIRRLETALRAELGRSAPDIVHSNGVKAHLLLALAGVAPARLVWHMHDYLNPRPTTTRLLRMFGARCDLAVATSQNLADDIARALPGGPPVAIVRNAVDLDVLSRPTPPADLDALSGLPPAPPGTVRVGLLGTFARWKGHDVFLRALDRLGDLPIRGYVIGGPVYRTAGSQYSLKELQQIADQLGLGSRVGFTGFQEDRTACLRALDVVVHASTAPEPFGLVVAEAMAAGRAVVTSATGGSAELVEPDVDALLHESGDAASLSDVLATAANDGGLRRRLGDRAALAARARFSPDRFRDEIEAAYRRVCPARAA